MHFRNLSITFLFILICIYSIAQPAIVLPKNNSYLPNNDVHFCWNKDQNALYYELILSYNSDFSNIYLEFPLVTSNDTTIEISVDTLFYWKVRSFNGSDLVDWIPLAIFTTYSPESISPNCIFRLNADSVKLSASSIDTLFNYNSNSYYAFQSIVTNKPTYISNVINGNPIIRFDGNDFLNGNGLVGDITKYSFFVVAKSNEFANYRWIYQNSPLGTNTSFSISAATASKFRFWSQGGSVFLDYNSTFNNTSFYLLSFTADNSLSIDKNKLYNNGFPDGVFNSLTTTHTNNGYKIGTWSAGSHYFKGDIAELVLFDTVLNSQERFYVDNYLRYKFFPDKYIEPVNLGFDIWHKESFCDTTLSAYKSYFTNYIWNTGATDSVINVNSTGIYSVTATDIYGFQYIDSVNVYFPHVSLITNTIICAGDTITWDTETTGAFSFEWLNNSSVDSYLELWESGDYAVTISDSFGCSYVSETISITIDPINILDSLGLDRPTCAGEPVSLNGYSGVIESYMWNNFNETASIIINESGTYSLTVTSPNGCYSVDSVNITIVGVAPEINFTSDTVCLGTATSFIDLSSVPSPDAINNWDWDFGSGFNSNLQNPQYTFTEFGSFPVVLSLLTDSGCTNIIIKNIIVKNNPISDFDILYGTSQCVEQNISFLNGSVPVSELISNQWYSDGIAFSSALDPVSFYSAPGVHEIQLVVTDDNECTDTSEILLTINSTMPLPAVFNLVSPINDFAFYETNTITFDWNESNNLLYYKFELSKNSNFNPTIVSQITTDNNLLLSISDTSQYFWRVTAFNLCLAQTVSEINTFSITTIDTNYISRWFDANYILDIVQDSLISSWTDKYSNYEFSHAVLSQFPVVDTMSEINNKKVARFDGINDNLSIDSSTVVGTVIAVCNYDSKGLVFDNFRGIINSKTTVSKTYLLLGQQNSDLLYVGGQNLFGQNIFINQVQSLSFLPLNKFKIVAGLTANSEFYNQLQIGAAVSAGRYWKGNIAEIIVFDTILNETALNNVYQYLRHKYSPPVNLSFDIRIPYNFCDTAITTAYKPWFTDYAWSTGETDSVIHVNRPGVYTVTVTDIFGFTSSDDIRVFYPTVKEFADTIVCYGESVIWDTERAGNYTYEWYGSSEITQAIIISDEGNYAAIITDTLGCKYYSDTISFSFDNYEFTASLGPADTALCSGNRLLLVSNAGETVSYLWNTGSTNPQIVLTATGTYTVTTTNWRGCEATDAIDVTITGFVPFPSFESSGHCFKNSVAFTDLSTSSDGEINSWIWRINGEVFSTDQNPILEASSSWLSGAETSGAETSDPNPETTTYNITLSIITENNCGDFAEIPLTVYPLPVVSFLPKYFCQHAETEFISTSAVNGGNVVLNLWDFGSFTASGTSVNYSFPAEGFQTIKLISTSEMSCADSLIKEIFVKSAELPVYSASNTCLGEDVYFINTTAYNPVNPGESWTWNFGDGGSSSLSNPQHAYANAGIFNTTLSIQYANRCLVSASLPVEVYFNPEARVLPADACVGVSFSPESEASSLSGNIISYTWNLNTDIPQTSVLQHPDFTISDTGSYILSLDLLTEYGCKTTSSDTVKVHENPISSFTASRVWGAIPLWVDFTNTSENGESYFWDFGDGEISTAENPYHIFTDSSIYTVRLVTTSEFGCLDSSKLIIKTIVPVMDVILYDLRTVMSGNYLQTKVYVINSGTLPVNNLEMILNLGDGKVYREIIEYLAPSQVIDFQFTLEVYIADGKTPELVCVEANPPAYEGHADFDLSNNSVCNTDVERLRVFQPYPNPATEQLLCEFIVVEQSDVTITLINGIGEVVYKKEISQSSGYTRLAINVKDFFQGVYYLQIRTGNEQVSYKVEVNR